MFSPANLYDMLFSFKTVEKLEPFGRVCEKLLIISFERIVAAFSNCESKVKAANPAFALSTFTSLTTS